MPLPLNKTKIVATIGPASSSPAVMEQMIRAGMNVARLNFSHGDFSSHRQVIENIRAAAKTTERRVTIMADLPGPKMRIGQLEKEPIYLQPEDKFTLTTEDIVGDNSRVSVSFDPLPQVVKPNDILYLNDGYIQLRAEDIRGNDIQCRVLVGGELRSRKGLNLPGIDLGISAFTDHDHACLKFALEHGVDAVSQSFVETEKDIQAVRKAAEAMGYHLFIIAKIERSDTLNHMEGILDAADGIMVARGDLGVEIPIEQIALAQKRLMHQANLKGKPVITATQMLESMTDNRRPTRAEATDVANAILDGTDCVMLSGESAMGKYPVEAVVMLTKIAASIESQRPGQYTREFLKEVGSEEDVKLRDLLAFSVETALERVSPAAVMVPTRSGASARSMTRFRLPVWIAAVCRQEAVCQGLQFSYGVYPVHEPDAPEDWTAYAENWLQAHGIDGKRVILTQGPSERHPETNHRIEFIEFE
jgi:pyruvate kinase